VKVVDIEARNCFARGFTKSIMKYMLGYNDYSERMKIINKGLVLNKYPWYVKVEL